MSFIVIATAAQFLNAIVAILDKYIVSDERALPRPFVYAFYSMLFSGAWVAIFLIGLLPITVPGVPTFANVSLPSVSVFVTSLIAAATFFIALTSLYKALQGAEASDVMPVVGAISAVASFALAYQLFGGDIVPQFILGILILVIGTFVLSHVRFTKRIALYALYSGVFFGAHYVAMKSLFLETNFDNGFFWSRIMMVACALALLFVPHYFSKIHGGTKGAGKHAGYLILINKALAGVAALMLLKATDMGDVAVVQALDGLKFVFILAIGILVGHKIPSTCGENSCRRREIVQKSIAVAIIILGFVILFVRM